MPERASLYVRSNTLQLRVAGEPVTNATAATARAIEARFCGPCGKCGHVQWISGDGTLIVSHTTSVPADVCPIRNASVEIVR